MLSPVGSHPSSVYWRRRIIALGSLILLVLLVVLTVRAITGDGGGAPTAGGPGSTGAGVSSTPSTPSRSSSRASTSASSSSKPSSSKPSTSASSTSPRVSSSAMPQRCATDGLAVQAVVGQTSYKVGAEPVLELQVTNSGARPCVQDLADKTVELKVYNGESRVWGSHDCEIQPGTADRTLDANRAVRVSIKWSGLTSQPGCTGIRQRVGAGTYTLYATLSGKAGKAAQFSIA